MLKGTPASIVSCADNALIVYSNYDVRVWPIATFRFSAEFGRNPGQGTLASRPPGGFMGSRPNLTVLRWWKKFGLSKVEPLKAPNCKNVRVTFRISRKLLVRILFFPMKRIPSKTRCQSVPLAIRLCAKEYECQSVSGHGSNPVPIDHAANTMSVSPRPRLWCRVRDDLEPLRRHHSIFGKEPL